MTLPGLPLLALGWSIAAPAMLWGMLGVAIPVIIHLLNRRRAAVIEWGAMQFLELGRRAERRFRFTELLLLLGRMLLLCLAAFAAARPIVTPGASARGHAGDAAAPARAVARDEPRDVAIILDGSESMARVAAGTTTRRRSIAWTRALAQRLPASSSMTVFDARERTRVLFEGTAGDGPGLAAALENAPAPRGAADVPAALAEALARVSSGRNAARDVVILSDRQRSTWRGDDAARWRIVKDIYTSMFSNTSAAPWIWCVDPVAAASASSADAEADGIVGPLEMRDTVVPVGRPIEVSAVVRNAGPGALVRAVDLLVDGVPAPGQRRSIGPIAAGEVTPVRFDPVFDRPGPRVLAVRLESGRDPLDANDECSRPVDVVEGVSVLVVDGDAASRVPGGETFFLRAALAPEGDATPVFRVDVVPLHRFAVDQLDGRAAVVLADVDRLDIEQSAALRRAHAAGTGVLFLPGDRTDHDTFNEHIFTSGSDWVPARLIRRVSPAGEGARFRPATGSFSGPSLGPLGAGESPALGAAELFWYHALEPARDADVAARLDTGDPWMVIRRARAGRAAVLAGPLDASGGSLPANPDFVPLMHALFAHIAGHDDRPLEFQPGEPITLIVPPERVNEAQFLTVTTPGGASTRADLSRVAGRVTARFEETDAPGIYRFMSPDDSAPVALAMIAFDPREREPELLSERQMHEIAEGWPLRFKADGDGVFAELLAEASGGPRSMWRAAIWAALVVLCLEIAAVRRMSRGGAARAGE